MVLPNASDDVIFLSIRTVTVVALQARRTIKSLPTAEVVLGRFSRQISLVCGQFSAGILAIRGPTANIQHVL